MTDPHADRVALRRRLHDLNDELDTLLDRVEGIAGAATPSVRRARAALFEAWTILCTPPEHEEDD